MSTAGQMELFILLPLGPKHTEWSPSGMLLDAVAEGAVLWRVAHR